MAKVSIIMGVYNCERSDRLQDCLESIKAQTETDWELILCDDGSTDGTYARLEQLAAQDMRIRVLHHEPNRGLGYALNSCIRSATGEYIARQDADDLSVPTRLEKQLRFLEQHPEYAFVGSEADVYNEVEGVFGEYRFPEKPDRKSFLWGSPFLHPSIVFRADVLREFMYNPGPEAMRSEDYELFMRMYAAGLRGYNMQEKLVKYYVRIYRHKKHRSMKNRVTDAGVRRRGFRSLGMRVIGIPFVIKPLIIGCIPQELFSRIEYRKYAPKAQKEEEARNGKDRTQTASSQDGQDD